MKESTYWQIHETVSISTLFKRKKNPENILLMKYIQEVYLKLKVSHLRIGCCANQFYQKYTNSRLQIEFLDISVFDMRISVYQELKAFESSLIIVWNIGRVGLLNRIHLNSILYW